MENTDFLISCKGVVIHCHKQFLRMDALKDDFEEREEMFKDLEVEVDVLR